MDREKMEAHLGHKAASEFASAEYIRVLNAELAALREENAKMRDALVEVEASGSCYCAKDIDGRRMGVKCPVCVARAALQRAKE